jgi:hypothetical protein
MSGQYVTPSDPVLFTLGDIAVSNYWVQTPTGTAPIAGSHWYVVDQTSTSRVIPTWAIVLCVLLIWLCFLGLLFLLAKEERTSGHFSVTVQAPGPPAFQHTCYIAVRSEQEVFALRQMFAHAQALASRPT